MSRIGIATGPAIGSMVGTQKCVYDIFGPAPNLAARLESPCEPLEFRINPEARDLIVMDFSIAECGVTDIKRFGEIPAFIRAYDIGQPH